MESADRRGHTTKNHARRLDCASRLRCNLAGRQVRDILKQIAERTSALQALETQILWRLLAERNSNIDSDGFPGF